MIRLVLQRWEGHPEHAFRDLTVVACAFATLFSVGWSFWNYHGRRPAVRVRRSAVDTLTMLLFYLLFSVVLARKLGVVGAASPGVELAAILAGCALVVVGCVVNVTGRHQLGPTWANQVTLYQGHQLLTGGLFGLVRHPLYASIIWMFLGAALAFLNAAALTLTCLVFIPAMHYRAGQEEHLLLSAFPEYAAYRQHTGRFFPRLFPTRHPKV